MLEPFGQDIWIAEGQPINAAMGFHYPTRMTVMRRDDGALLIWSAIALTNELRETVEGLGEVLDIVAPNHLHDTWIGDWLRAFPEARGHGTRQLVEKRPELGLSALPRDAAPEGWEDALDLIVLESNAITAEAVAFHRASLTAVFTDLLQQMPRGWYSGWRAVVARLDLMVGDEPAVPRKFRLAFRDKGAARADVRRVLDWSADNVVMAHGTPVRGGGAAFLRRAFVWLKPYP